MSQLLLERAFSGANRPNGEINDAYADSPFAPARQLNRLRAAVWA